MKVSVIMIDGSFRENIYGAEYFTNQDFSQDEFEVFWVEFYSRANEDLYQIKDLKIITLNHSEYTTYHSSFCFNEGIKQATGELLIIPDADVIVESDFIQKAWDTHQGKDDLVAYGYRCNEVPENRLEGLSFDELQEKCVITNSINYGGCLTARKKWFLEINGYDEHKILESGFHANGLDIYTRFRNFGLPIKWDRSLLLYHPMHAFTSEKAPEYKIQHKLINWRSKNLEVLPLSGIDPKQNTKAKFQELDERTKASGSNAKSNDRVEKKNSNFIQRMKKIISS